MNDRRTLQKKRRAAANGGLMILHSKTRPRHKQRVAAGSAAVADLGSEVPNLGVARALLVILVLHVAAIAAIFVHNKVTDEDPVVRASVVKEVPKALIGGGVEEVLPQVQQGEDYYFVATGDTYEKIARVKAVDVTALKQLNKNVALRAGRILRMPAESAVPAAAQVPAQAALEPISVALEVAEMPPIAAALIEDIPRAMIVEEQPPAPIETAVVVSVEAPVMVTPRAIPPVAEIVPEPTTLQDSGIRYKVKSGESIWAISRRYKVSQDDMLKLNGIVDARKLRAGMELKIPASN